MAEEEPADEEPPVGALPANADPKGRRSFRSARRELTDEELTGSGVAKMMLDEIERLESECSSGKSFLDRFHNSDKEVGILREKLKQKQAFEILTGGALAIGSAMMGFAPNAWEKYPLAGGMFLGLGLILAAVGVVAKVREK